MISIILAATALAPLCSTFLVARLSRWRWLSPWHAACVLTGAALLIASGAEDGHWLACAAGVAVAVMQAVASRMTARARRRVADVLAAKAGEAS